MARPIKNSCDYFSHDNDMRNHRKIKSLRNKFGINGYGIWVMLLEYLTGIDGNEFEYTDFELELIAGDFGVSVTEIREVVSYCILLELLFDNNGFICSDSLNKRLEPVYRKRGIAKKISENRVRKEGQFVKSTEPLGVSVTEKPQSKVKESKVKEIINLSNFIKDENWLNLVTEWLEYKKERKQTYKSERSTKAMYNELLNLSKNNIETAKLIISKAMANNYSGFFAIKETNKPNFVKQQELEEKLQLTSPTYKRLD